MTPESRSTTRTLTLSVLGLVLVAGVTWLVLPQRGGREAALPPPSAADGATNAHAVAPDGVSGSVAERTIQGVGTSTSARTPGPIALSTPPPFASALVGRLVDERGAPIAEQDLMVFLAEVVGYMEDPDYARSQYQRTGRTDEQGRFALADLPALTNGTILSAQREGFAPLFTGLPPLRSGEITDVGDVLWHSPGRVRGIVLDQDDEPVGGAAIHWTRVRETYVSSSGGTEVARAAADGSFEVAAVPPEPLRFCAVTENGVATWSRPVEVEPRGVHEGLVLRVSTGVDLHGRLVELNTGQGLSGTVTAYAASEARRVRATADANGRFVLRGLEPDTRYVWSSSVEGYRYATSEDSFGGTNVFWANETTVAEPFVVTLLPYRVKSLRVVDANTRASIAGAQVLRAAVAPSAGAVLDDYFLLGTTDGQGRFDVPTDRGPVRFLVVRAAGYADTGVYPEGVKSDEVEQRVELRAAGELRIHVTCVGADVPDARVDLLYLRSRGRNALGNEAFLLKARASTAADGIARFPGLASGSYLARVWDDGRPVAFADAGLGDGEDLELEIPIGGNGRLLGRVDRAGPRDVVAAIPRHGDRRLQEYVFWTWVGGDGNYLLPELPPGEYAVALLRARAGEEPEAMRMRHSSLRVHVLAGSDTRLDLRAWDGAAGLRGSARLDGEPAVGRKVSLTWLGTSTGAEIDLPVPGRSLLVDAFGAFEASDLLPGRWGVRLGLDPGDLGAAVRGVTAYQEVTLTDGEVSSVELTGASARLTILGRSADPTAASDLVRVEIELVEKDDPDTHFEERLTFPANSPLVLPEIPTGRVRIELTSTTKTERFVDLTPGGDHEVVFELEGSS